MVRIEYTDEIDLQKKICEILNKSGYKFEKGPNSYFCDIYDLTIRAYGEVKLNGNFAPQQLLYGLARESIKNAQYLILANEFELRVYKCPVFKTIYNFAISISPDLSKNPSSIIEINYKTQAFEILAKPVQIYFYDTPFKVDSEDPIRFIDEKNYEYIQAIFNKYRINPSEFINKFATTWSSGSSLYIKNDKKTIVDKEALVQLEAKRKIEQFDIQFIESIRIKPEDIGGIIHKMDTLAPLDIRRKGGKFWTNVDLADVTKQLIEEYVQPTYIFEPFVGGGSLVRGFVETCSGVVNDWDQYAIDLLKKEWEGYNWDFYVKNIHTTPINEIERWIKTKEDDIFLIYTNPPFGTVSTNALVSKSNELDGASSRNITIRYGCDDKEENLIKRLYGSGDLFLPSIGKMIELIKRKATGYLAFFCPSGAFMGRTRYQKIFDELLKNFRFLHGEIYSGKYFNNVSKQKAIAFTIWKYERNANTEKTSLKFMFEGKEYGLKMVPLLKDGWKYDERENHFGEIMVQHCETFNSAPPKMFHLQPEKGGSEVVAQNVKIPLNVPHLCDPILYALWSVTVGYRAIVTPPVVFDNCYVHLPDFKDPRVQEILALSALYVLIEELTNNYCNGKIGFVGMSRVFVFGGSELTGSVNYLLSTYGSLKIDGSRSLKDVFDALRNEKDSNKMDKNLRSLIREQIKVRLDEIGYWDFLPIQ